MHKYSSLTSTYSFAPISIETMGAWGEGAKCIIKKIGQRVRWTPGESRSTVFLIQRFAIDVQRGNVASIMATIPSSRDWGEISNLPPIYLTSTLSFVCLYIRLFIVVLIVLFYSIFVILMLFFIIIINLLLSSL